MMVKQLKRVKVSRVGMNYKLKDVSAAQGEWDTQRIWFYTKSKNKRDFIGKVKRAFDLYMVYAAISTGYQSTGEIYSTVLTKFGVKLDRRVICRVVRDGYDCQHFFKRHWQYRFVPPGVRAYRVTQNILNRLDKEKDGFNCKTLFDIIS